MMNLCEGGGETGVKGMWDVERGSVAIYGKGGQQVGEQPAVLVDNVFASFLAHSGS